MTSLQPKPVFVTYCVTPHDFCIIEKDVVADRAEFESRLQQPEGNYTTITPRLGMLLLIIDGKWKRAIVDEVGSGCCTFWLVDYGGYVISKKAYQLPDEFKIPPPFIKHAALIGVVGVKKEFSISGIENKTSIKFTPGASHRLQQYITDSKEIYFSCISCEDLCKGELFITDKRGNRGKLSDILITRGLATVDIALFEKAIEKIILSKKRLLIWSQICGKVSKRMPKPRIEHKSEKEICKNSILYTSINRKKVLEEYSVWLKDLSHLAKNNSSTQNSSLSLSSDLESSDSAKTQIEVQFDKRKEKSKPVEIEPHTEVKPKDNNELTSWISIKESPDSNKIQTVDCSLLNELTSPKTKLQLEMLPPVLVEGFLTPSPVQYLGKVPFESGVLKYLKKLNNIYPIQSYMWPMILRGLSTFAISPTGSGKTLGYLLPICSLFTEKGGQTPSVLIVCAETSTAEDIFDTLQNILEYIVDKPRCSLLSHPPIVEGLKKTLNNNDILITTPPILKSLLNAETVNVKQLSCVVLEQGSSLLKKFSEEINNLVKLLEETTQIILCSDIWTNSIEEFRSSLSIPSSVCVGSPLEAAVFTKAKFEAYLLNDLTDRNILYDIFKDKKDTYKSIVVCDSISSIKEVEVILKRVGLSVLKVEDVATDLIKEIEQTWTCQVAGDKSVLVCTDSIFECLHLRGVTTLVHYNLPVSWIEFVNRFHCLLPENPIQKKVATNTAAVHVIMDKSSSKKLLKIVAFLQRVNCEISFALERDFKVALNRTEEEKSYQGISLCNELQLFGNCSSNKCEKRHKVFPYMNETDSFPSSGIIEYKIMHINDVNSFLIKITQYEDVEGNRKEWMLDESIDEFLNQNLIREKESVKDPKPGLVCAVEVSGLYKSCVISSCMNKLRKVAIKLLQSEKHLTVSTSSLWNLPEHFHFKSITNIILAHVIPPGQDKKWSTDAKQLMKNVVGTTVSRNTCVHFTSKILLQIEDVLWVEDMHVINNQSITFDMKKLLTDNKLITICEKQMKALKNIAQEQHSQGQNSIASTSRTSLSDEWITKEWEDEIKDPSWSYLVEGYNKVAFSSGLSPDSFYVRLVRDDHLVKAFEESIRNEELSPVTEIEVGGYYIAVDPKTNEYNRSLVIKEEGDKVHLFYVDFGDYGTMTKSCLKQMKQEHITAFPFQAIHCRLYGVQPVLDCWSPETIDILYKIATEPDSDIMRTLYAKRVKELVAENGHVQYEIVLADYYNQQAKFVQTYIIEAEFGIVKESEDLSEFSLEDVEIFAAKYDNEDDMCIADDDELEGILKSVLNIDLDEIRKSTEQESPKVKEIVTNEVTPNCSAVPIVNSGHLTPKIIWSQTNKNIKIKVDLPHIEDYQIKLIRGVLLVFSATYHEKEYKSKYHLYSKVDNRYQCNKSGLYIQINLSKSSDKEWPRLIVSEKKQIHISYEVTSFEESQDKDKPLLQLEQSEDDDHQFYYCVSGSDGEYTDSSDYD